MFWKLVWTCVPTDTSSWVWGGSGLSGSSIASCQGDTHPTFVSSVPRWMAGQARVPRVKDTNVVWLSMKDRVMARDRRQAVSPATPAYRGIPRPLWWVGSPRMRGMARHTAIGLVCPGLLDLEGRAVRGVPDGCCVDHSEQSCALPRDCRGVLATLVGSVRSSGQEHFQAVVNVSVEVRRGR